MRILFAADEHSYSTDALPQVARLGENTWADITLLGVSNQSKAMADIVNTYYKKLSEYFDPKLSPYQQSRSEGNMKTGIHKQITTRIRRGNPSREILEEAKKAECDLIVIGCSTQKDYTWKDAGDVPLKVAKDADCSVLVIKEDKKINKMLCCLDHDNISQESLEMVSQMITLFHADLDIVVLTDSEDVQGKIEKKLSWLIDYYSTRDIFPCIELVKLTNLETFVSRKVRWGLMAMWMGKKSILERVFPSSKVSRLLKANESSVLLLR
ncbi:MAG: universal stress protein [Deltaproteobacteria bacterium]|nr:universal stress protein [Deltaproteobacteria bacterium]